eukprot:CAMPEP_0116151180 /NCGR_PEP_ID=MMETSP0329-20121206/19955_1 /TAXON_ID=697910 /ORGANISM="Pseudo-nitzschia arenysensis, Strain B593" /LENGTH=392 /DNA_ID=CAMNT_0003647767 /DNA_START=252 /DNA_END=1430 /DNA_ORIENTATION=-
MSSFDRTFGNDDQTEWGLMFNENTRRCPMTPVQVVNDVFDAIAGTLYDKQKPDPSIASNARATGLFSYRPTRAPSDEGRIGIEIDGAEFMFPSKIAPERAQRIFSLILAAKLSHDCSWSKYEEEEYPSKSFRTIALSFNTINEALLARQEMQMLQRNCRTDAERNAFDNIIVQTLADGLPEVLYAPKTKKRVSRTTKLAVQPKKGLLLIVQPTDFNDAFDPARPSVHSLDDFQKSTTAACIQKTPVVVLSPRFMSYGDSEAPDNQIYQSGFQQASYYGGIEPPRGPAPLLLRDFSPPSYCWIGDALSVASNDQFLQNLSRVVLTNSVMDEDHPWHIYAASGMRRRSSNKNSTADGRRSIPESVYLASTRSTSGRPTWAIMNKILNGSISELL